MPDATYVGAGTPCGNCGNPLTPGQPHKCGRTPEQPTANPYRKLDDEFDHAAEALTWDEGFAAGRAALPDPPTDTWKCCGQTFTGTSDFISGARSAHVCDIAPEDVPDAETAYAMGKAAALPDKRLREALLSDAAVEAAAMTYEPDTFIGDAPNADDALRDARAVLVAALAAADREKPGQKITHGRHCTCTPCAVEDWTNPAFTPCGMHGRDCPQEYQPLGPAGSFVPPVPDDQKATTTQ